VFEPTSTYSRRLETLCRASQISCCRLNPRVVPHLRLVGKGRSKTDSSDAELLYRYGIERGQQEAAQLENDALAESIQARLTCYRVAQKARVAYQNVLEALSQDPATSGELLGEVREEIRELKSKEKQQVDAAQKLIEDDSDTKHRFDLLLSIPGVGPITALTLVALFRKYAKLKTESDCRVGRLRSDSDPVWDFRTREEPNQQARESGSPAQAVRGDVVSCSLQPKRQSDLPKT